MPSQPTERTINVIDWGRLAYDEAHLRQLSALENRLAGRVPDTVFLVEHPHVFTCGRGTDRTELQRHSVVRGQQIPWVEVERGGEVTYHGPGQLVAYPVVDVRSLTGDLHKFLHWLEDVIIRTIARWGIEGRHHPEHTGVWVDDRKIASIGVAVRRWISYHGIALNVTTDLEYFAAIQPCGLTPDVMTSMFELTGKAIDPDDVKRVFTDCLREPYPAPAPELPTPLTPPADQ